MGGSGGGSKPKEQKAPPQAEPIDYAKLMAESRKEGGTNYADQLNAQISAYPKQERLQLGTISNLSANLSGDGGALYENRYTPGTTRTIGKGKNKKTITTAERWDKVQIGEAAPNLYTQRATNQLLAAEDQATQIGNIAADTERLSAQATQDLQGTDLERELQRQAEGDLALGRSLNPEQERAATQQARAGMSARGLGTGTGALAAEVLNRDAYASAREAERRNFAESTNQMLVSNRQNRLGLVGKILGQAANTRLNQANLRTSLAGANITIDPYSRAMNPALGLGGSTLGQSGQIIGNTYSNATQMAGNVASFNANMLDSRYNSFMNNKANLFGANAYGNSSNKAGNTAMGAGIGMAGGALAGAAIGSVVPVVGTLAGAAIGGALGAAGGGGVGYMCWIARAAWGEDNPRWIEFRHSMLAYAPDWFLKFYLKHGQSIARHINTPARRAAARFILSKIQILWTPTQPKRRLISI